EANGHDHQKCNTLGLCGRLPGRDRDLVGSACADRLLARTRPLWTRRLWVWPAARPLRPPARAVWLWCAARLPTTRLWSSTRTPCPTEPVRLPAAPRKHGRSPAGDQRPADQPG